MTEKSYTYSETAATKLVSERIDALSSRKKQKQIAIELGYTQPNFVSMIKRGESKIPIDKIHDFARVLEIDPGHLFRIVILSHWPNYGPVVDSIFGTILTKNEVEILTRIRDLTDGADPALDAALDAKLVSMFER